MGCGRRLFLGWARSAAVGWGGGAGVSPDDAEAAGSVEVDSGDAQVEPQAGLGASDRGSQQPRQADQAHRITNFDHYRPRVLLYAGKPDWNLFDGLTPRQSAKSPISSGS